jgi:thioredoxin 1
LTPRPPIPTYGAGAGSTRVFFFEVAMSATAKVTDSTFDSDVLKSNEPVVVDFWAEWCGPCRMIGPSLEEIASEMKGKVKIAKLNIDENPAVAEKLGIRSIPTLMMFKDGKLSAQKTGAAPKSELVRWINASV